MGDETAPQEEYERQRTDPELMGREDVLLDVPRLHLDSLELEIADLRARVSLQAEVLNLLRLNVGIDANLGQAHLDLRGVDAQALLKVRLENVVSLVDRVLKTLDAHPEMVEPLVRGVEETLRATGRGAGYGLGRVGPATTGPLDAAADAALRPTAEEARRFSAEGHRREKRPGADARRRDQRAEPRTTSAVRAAGQGVAEALGEAEPGGRQGPEQPDIEARAVVDIEGERREEGGPGVRRGDREPGYRSLLRRIRRRW